jgi:DNA-binding GntR family transcriptional regulator
MSPGGRNERVGRASPAADPDLITSVVERCQDEIRKMILSGRLAPGQKVHQAELADQLSVSRVPVREALSRLNAEGLLQYRSNVGFSVARFNADELSEIYLMRRLLETELLLTVELHAIDVEALNELNERMKAVDHRSTPEVYQKLNVDFHFMIFQASPLTLLCQEVERLWNMSAYYRSLHLFVSPDTRHLSAEHDRIVATVRTGDLPRLIAVSDHHRSGTERVDGMVARA